MLGSLLRRRRSTAFWLVLGSLVGIAAAAPAQEAAEIPLRQLPLETYDLRDWGTRWYTVYGYPRRLRVEAEVIIAERMAKRFGRVKLETRVSDDRVELEDSWVDPAGERGWAFLYFECRRDSLLSLMRMTVQQGARTDVCDVTDGRYSLTQLGRARGGDWPADTVIEASLLRVFTLLPKTPGGVYPVGNFAATPEIRLMNNPGDAIRCLGTETIEIEGRSMDCTKYVYRDHHAWVRDADNVLVRFEIPGWKILEIIERPTGGLPASEEAPPATE